MKRALLLASLLLVAACQEETAQSTAPVSLTSETVGHYCQMNLTEHPGPKGQVHLDGLPGAPLFFSQVRDAVAYARLPEQDHTILAIWVSDMGAAGATWEEPGAANWINAAQAYYVVGSARVGGMGAEELVPFADPARAAAFVAGHGGQIMRLADIPDAAVIAPEGPSTPQADNGETDADFERRLQALSHNGHAGG